MKKVLDNHFFPMRYRRSVEQCVIEVCESNGFAIEGITFDRDDTYLKYGIVRMVMHYMNEFVGYMTIIDDYYRNERIVNIKTFNNED